MVVMRRTKRGYGISTHQNVTTWSGLRRIRLTSSAKCGDQERRFPNRRRAASGMGAWEAPLPPAVAHESWTTTGSRRVAETELMAHPCDCFDMIRSVNDVAV